MPGKAAISDVQTLFKCHFGSTPTHVVRAPGSLELLGCHALCGDGLAISAAINRFVSIAATPRRDGKIELVAAGGRESFWLSEIRPNPASSWADGIKSVLGQLRRRGANLSGFSAAIWDDMPPGIELGRAAAVAVATGLTLRQLYPFSLTETGVSAPPRRNAKGQLPGATLRERLCLAKLCQASSERVGLVDPMTSLFGKAWHVLSIDLRFGTVEPAPMIGVAIVVCFAAVASGESEGCGRSGGTPGAAEIRACCDSAAARLGAKSLRSVEMSLLKASRSKLTVREYECACFVVGETARVVGAERALRGDDQRQLGQFMLQGHDSSREMLKDATPEVDLLVELARAQPGCLGARRCGSEGGDATINLVAFHQAEEFRKQMVRRYEIQTREKLQTFVLQMTDAG